MATHRYLQKILRAFIHAAVPQVPGTSGEALEPAFKPSAFGTLLVAETVLVPTSTPATHFSRHIIPRHALAKERRPSQ